MTRTIPLSAAKLKLPSLKTLRVKTKTKFMKEIKNLVTDFNMITYKISLTLNALFHSVDQETVKSEVVDLRKLYHAIYNFVSIVGMKKNGNPTSTRAINMLKFPEAFNIAEKLNFVNTGAIVAQNSIDYEAKQFATNLDNFEVTHDKSMVKQMLIFKHHANQMRKQDLTRLADFIVWKMYNGFIPEHYDTFREQERDVARQIFEEFPTNLDFVQLLEFRLQMKDQILTCENIRVNDKVWKPKLFNLGPMPKMGVCCTYLDKRVLAQITMINIQSKDLTDMTLQDFFDVDLCALAPADWDSQDKIPLSAITDGHQLHVTYQKRIKEDSIPAGEFLFCNQFKRTTSNVAEARVRLEQVIGVDPGVVNIFSTCTGSLVSHDGKRPEVEGTSFHKVTSKQ